MTTNPKNVFSASGETGETSRSDGGFSLVEMIIAMTLMLIVMAAAYQVLRIAIIQRNTVSTRIDAVKSARIALNYIRRDGINAGLSYHSVGGITPVGYVNNLMGIATVTDPERDALTGIISGDGVTDNTLNPSVKMDSIGFVTRDLEFNDGNSIGITGTSADGQNINVQTAAGAAAECRPYDLYLMETGTSQIVGLATAVPSTSSFKLGFGAADPLGVNQSATGSGNGKSLLAGSNFTGTLKKINLVTYSVAADGTLLRKIYGNNTGQPASEQIQSHQLIYNVRDFQVSYLMEDGTIKTNPTSGNNGSLNQQKMNDVIQVEISITVVPDRVGLQVSTPITLKEVISTRNLRYTVN